MNLDSEEFSDLTGRLEQYASQVSELRTRLEMQEKQAAMQGEMNELKVKNAELQAQLSETQKKLDEVSELLRRRTAECESLQNDCTTLKKAMNAQLVEKAFLENCLLLSLSGIKDFMHIVKRIDLKALFYTFLTKTLSPEMGQRGLKAVNEAVVIEEECDKTQLLADAMMKVAERPTYNYEAGSTHDDKRSQLVFGEEKEGCTNKAIV